MILSGNELSPFGAKRGSTSVDSSRSRSSPNVPSRSSIVRRFTKDCIFNVNVYNRVFSRHTPTVYVCAFSLSHSFVVNVSLIDFSNLKPYSYVTLSPFENLSLRPFKRTMMRRGMLDAFSRRHRGQRFIIAFPLCLAHDLQIREGVSSRRRTTRSHPR